MFNTKIYSFREDFSFKSRYYRVLKGGKYVNYLSYGDGQGATKDSEYQEGQLSFSTKMKDFTLPKELECFREESDVIKMER